MRAVSPVSAQEGTDLDRTNPHPPVLPTSQKKIIKQKTKQKQNKKAKQNIKEKKRKEKKTKKLFQKDIT